MKFLNRYNESRDSYLISEIEDYSSEFIDSIIYHGFDDNKHIFYVYEKGETKPCVLYLDTSYKGHLKSGNQIRAFYMTPSNMLMDIKGLGDWKLIVGEIERRCSNRVRNRNRMKLVEDMFSKLNENILLHHFSDSIDIGIKSSVLIIEQFNKPLYYNIYIEVPFYHSTELGSMTILLDDKYREFIDTIVVNSKRIEEEFPVLCSLRIGSMHGFDNPIFTISIYAKDNDGKPIGM